MTDERALWALWGSLSLLIATLVLARAVGSALFLSHFDGEGLALAYCFVGGLVSLAVAAGSWLSRGGSPERALRGTLLLLACTALVGVWEGAGGAVNRFDPLRSGVLYLALESLAFFSTVQFWSLVNSRFTPALARTWYVKLGTGGVVGSIVGGGLARLLAPYGIVMAWGAIVALVVGQLVLLRVTAGYLPPTRKKSVRPSPLRPAVVLDSPDQPPGRRLLASAVEQGWGLSAALAFVSLAMVLATTLVDFFYKSAVDHYCQGDAPAMTALFGLFFVWVGLATLVLQLGLTPWVLQRRRPFVGLAVSPVVLLGGAILAAATPGLLVAVLIKLADSALHHSVYRSCQEWLYTPLPAATARRLKAFSDGIMNRLGLMLAGLILWTESRLWGPLTALEQVPLLLASLVVWLAGIGVLAWFYAPTRRGTRRPAFRPAVVLDPDEDDEPVTRRLEYSGRGERSFR